MQPEIESRFSTHYVLLKNYNQTKQEQHNKTKWEYFLETFSLEKAWSYNFERIE